MYAFRDSTPPPTPPTKIIGKKKGRHFHFFFSHATEKETKHNEQPVSVHGRPTGLGVQDEGVSRLWGLKRLPCFPGTPGWVSKGGKEKRWECESTQSIC